MDDKLDLSSFSLYGGPQSKRTRYPSRTRFHHHESIVSFGPQDVHPNDRSTNEILQAHQFEIQLDPSPLLFPSMPRTAPIPLYAAGSSHLRSGYSARSYTEPFISAHDPRVVVATPGLSGHTELIDRHAYHHVTSLRSIHDNYITGYPCATQPPSITMPIVPTFLAADESSHLDPIFPLDPTLGWSPYNPNAALQHPPTSDSSPGPSTSGYLDSKSHYSPTPFPMDNSNLVPSHSEISDEIESQPVVTALSDHTYTSTVPLTAIEFPPISHVDGVPFFQCRWGDCGIWITSDKEAVKRHLACTHNVMLKGSQTDSVCCEWDRCSSSLQRGGLVRHFQTHLGLRWVCSVCKGPYTRQDSVGFHTRKEPRCRQAQAISHPSTAAYRARINENSTVTFTKVLQP